MNIRSNLVFDIGIYLVKRHTIGAFGFLLAEDLHILNSNNVGIILIEEWQGSSYLWRGIGHFSIERQKIQLLFNLLRSDKGQAIYEETLDLS